MRVRHQILRRNGCKIAASRGVYSICSDERLCRGGGSSGCSWGAGGRRRRRRSVDSEEESFINQWGAQRENFVVTLVLTVAVP